MISYQSVFFFSRKSVVFSGLCFLTSVFLITGSFSLIQPTPRGGRVFVGREEVLFSEIPYPLGDLKIDVSGSVCVFTFYGKVVKPLCWSPDSVSVACPCQVPDHCQYMAATSKCP